MTQNTSNPEQTRTRRSVLVFALASLCSVGAVAQERAPSTNSGSTSLERGLSLSGTASLTNVTPIGFHFMSGAITLRNLSGRSVELARGHALFATTGGYVAAVVDVGPSFFGLGPGLSPSPAPLTAPLNWYWSTPIAYQIYRVDGSTDADRLVSALASMPVLRAGFEPPAPSIFRKDAALAVQGPLEVVRLTTGQDWLTVVGQVVDTVGLGNNATMTAKIKNSSGSTLAAIEMTPQSRDKVLVWPFFGASAVPPGTAGLQLDATLETQGKVVSLSRKDPVVRVRAVPVFPPLSGRWLYLNGPGEQRFHTHFAYPEQRYAYDLSILRLVNGVPSSHDGDPGVNESYFAWGQPIHAALDGEVVEVVDEQRDNNGNISVNPEGNNRIVLRHAGGVHTVYTHPRQGSAVVTVGQLVSAGDVLAQVGNAGFSTEPHLHFSAYRIDATGRVQAVPTSFRGLTSTSGTPLRGVPLGDQEYVTP